MSGAMPKSKLSAVVYLLLVFLSGALVGSLSYRLYAMNTVSASSGLPKASPEEFRRRYIEGMRAKVNLDEKQVEQVNQILDETRAQFDQMRAKMRSDGEAIQNQQVAKITEMLRDDQKPSYAAFRAEREKLRQQMRRQKR
jgi:Spy/CpxP family protein refolding chaperone